MKGGDGEENGSNSTGIGEIRLQHLLEKDKKKNENLIHAITYIEVIAQQVQKERWT